MEYQSLYRRFRPRTFADVRGQEHVIKALQNAVREERVGHAYLLSGPRGTGKTTLARILAKVLNCENPVDGEPCDTCESCVSINAGTSFDLHELDAASNNKVDDIRDLIGKVNLGTPGRHKVYLLDEVHMLTTGAENALLKTLEEPPDHVVFVMATTEPHKVVPTIRSRTQHLELTLLPADTLAEHVRWIAAEADLELDEESIEYVVQAGGGSARDTLSALDQVVAAGGIGDRDTSTTDLLEALAAQDPGIALSAVAAATERGLDPRTVGEALIGALRDVFLFAMGTDLGYASASQQQRAEVFAARLTPAAITRALDKVGTALVDMRQAADPRIDLEVALVQLTRPEIDSSVGALSQRIARLEAALADGATTPAPVPSTPAAVAAAPTDPAPTDPAPSEAAPAAAVAPASADPAPADPAPVAVAPREAAPPAAPAATNAPPATPAAPAASPEVSPPPVPVSQGSRPADSARAFLKSKGIAPPPLEAIGENQPPPVSDGVDDGSVDDADVADVDVDDGGTDASTTQPQPAPEPVAAAAPAPAASPAPTEATATAAPSSGGSLPELEVVRDAWTESIRDTVSKKARSRFSSGEISAVELDTVTMSLPNDMTRQKCDELRPEYEAAFSSHFGGLIKVQLVVGTGSTPPPSSSAPRPAAPAGAATVDETEEVIDMSELTDAPQGGGSLDRLTEAFPGAEVVDEP